jgi:phage-related protein
MRSDTTENALRVKPLYWVASSKKDLLALPEEGVDVFGCALYLAQIDKKQEQARPLKVCGSAGVL